MNWGRVKMQETKVKVSYFDAHEARMAATKKRTPRTSHSPVRAYKATLCACGFQINRGSRAWYGPTGLICEACGTTDPAGNYRPWSEPKR
jgi:hypothetical protein